jgi:hypothetical protein
MLTGLHILLTYTCPFECDHCFLFCGPRASGTFTLDQIRRVLRQAEDLGTIEWIYFEGGEPFLYHPLLVEGIRRARLCGFKVGVVTNAYFAHSEEDATLWLRPLAELGVSDLSVSDDDFHSSTPGASSASVARSAAEKLGIPCASICIEEPTVRPAASGDQAGRPVVGGGALFKGRAVETLTAGLPRVGWERLDSCPHEELARPSRVHLDCFGHVHLCQGVSMGNFWQTPLPDLVANYDPHAHPICGPLLRGGPAELARTYGVSHEETYVDECHLCFVTRRALLARFPDLLAPAQVYGVETTS